MNPNDNVPSAMLEEYIFYYAKKHHLLHSLQFSVEDAAMNKINCYSLREIILKKAFDMKFEIRYSDDDNPNNGNQVQITREDFKFDDMDCWLINMRLQTQKNTEQQQDVYN